MDLSFRSSLLWLSELSQTSPGIPGTSSSLLLTRNVASQELFLLILELKLCPVLMVIIFFLSLQTSIGFSASWNLNPKFLQLAKGPRRSFLHCILIISLLIMCHCGHIFTQLRLHYAGSLCLLLPLLQILASDISWILLWALYFLWTKFSSLHIISTSNPAFTISIPWLCIHSP